MGERSQGRRWCSWKEANVSYWRIQIANYVSSSGRTPPLTARRSKAAVNSHPARRPVWATTEDPGRSGSNARGWREVDAG